MINFLFVNLSFLNQILTVMKKLIFIIIISVGFIAPTQAQTINDVKIENIQVPYLEIIGTHDLQLASVNIKVDYGQMAARAKMYKVLDENGNRIGFNSMVDALNFFAKYGYKLVTAYEVIYESQGTYHYILKKEIETAHKKNSD